VSFVRHLVNDTARTLMTLIGALVIGLGIPYFWIWVGSKIQGGADQLSMTSQTAIAVFPGIVITYVLVLVVFGWFQSKWLAATGRKPQDNWPVRRSSWNRSMRDSPHQPEKLTPIEAMFVVTALLAGALYIVWFFLFAGSSGSPGGLY
jgi:hypothetical protein